MTEQPKKKFWARVFEGDADALSGLFIGFVIFLLIVSGAVALVALCNFGKPTLGAFGDFIGGVLNPILTFLTLVGVLITVVLQQRQTQKTEDSTRRQNFEASFFQMLSVHNSIVNAMDIKLANGTIRQGRDCFKVFHNRLVSEYRKIPATDPDREQKAYEVIRIRYTQDLGHYFRYLYNMYRVIDQSAPEGELFSKLFRAQLSDYELIMLYYNLRSPLFSKNWQPFIQKYDIFNNMPDYLKLDNISLDVDDELDDAPTAVAKRISRRAPKKARTPHTRKA